MAYIRTIVHYYLWEGGGQDEGRYFIIEDFINRGGGEGSNLLMNSSLNIPYFFFEVVPYLNEFQYVLERFGDLVEFKYFFFEPGNIF